MRWPHKAGHLTTDGLVDWTLQVICVPHLHGPSGDSTLLFYPLKPMLKRQFQAVRKIIPQLRDLSYESSLLQCGLTTLETRRLRGDQIEVFTIVL